MQAIKQTDTNSDYFTLYLDCFFELANNEEINENMRYFTDYSEQLHENDIRKIVDYVESIDSDEVKLFFEAIAICDNVSEDIMNQVYCYLYTL